MTLRTVIKFRDNRQDMEVMESYEEVIKLCREVSFGNLFVSFRAYEPGEGEIQRAVILSDIYEITKH